jgi:hypothetical protein
MYYFGYIQNDYPFSHSVENCIFFHIIRFDIPELSQQMDRKENCVQIRLSTVNEIFPVDF